MESNMIDCVCVCVRGCGPSFSLAMMDACVKVWLIEEKREEFHLVVGRKKEKLTKYLFIFIFVYGKQLLAKGV